MSIKVSALAVLEELANRDKKEAVFAFPLHANFVYARTGKNGWGEITIAVSNHIIANIDKFSGSLYLANKEEYSKVEEELWKGGEK